MELNDFINDLLHEIEEAIDSNYRAMAETKSDDSYSIFLGKVNALKGIADYVMEQYHKSNSV